MFRHLLKFILVLTISVNFIGSKQDALVEEKLALLEEKIVDEGLDYLIVEGTYVVFNYEAIERLTNAIFKDYAKEIIKESQVSFILKVYLKRGIIDGSREERFYIEEGTYEKYL